MKKFWASKTFWVNAVTIVAGVVGYLAGNEVISNYPAFVSALVAAQGVINVVLRFLTWKPIEL